MAQRIENPAEYFLDVIDTIIAATDPDLREQLARVLEMFPAYYRATFGDFLRRDALLAKMFIVMSDATGAELDAPLEVALAGQLREKRRAG